MCYTVFIDKAFKDSDMHDLITLTGIKHIEKGQLCQDYSIGFTVDQYTFLVLSDGCSSGGATDLGARLICLKAKQLLQKDPELIKTPTLIEEKICQYIAENQLELHAVDYLATLQIVGYDGQLIYVISFGDGAFGFIKKDGSQYIVTADYSNNAPYYFNYKINANLGKAWLSQEKGIKKITTYVRTDATESFEVKNVNSFTPKWDSQLNTIVNTVYYDVFDASDISMLFIATDGFMSFEKCTMSQVWEQLLGFKSTVGQFVQRRLAAQSRRWLKDLELGPSDDLSIGVIVTEKEA